VSVFGFFISAIFAAVSTAAVIVAGGFAGFDVSAITVIVVIFAVLVLTARRKARNTHNEREDEG
jgi:sugar phosphate permease